MSFSASRSLPDAAPRARVLIVDDSAVARAVIARIVEEGDQFTVTRAVATVDQAMAFLAGEQVDIILLDIHLPGTDGLTALPDLIVAGRGAKVVIVSSMAGEGAAISIQALALGAADKLVKPAATDMSSAFARALTEKLERLVRSEPAATMPAPVRLAPAPRPGAASPTNDDAYDVVGIGASTGGIHALSALLRTLPAGFRLPIVITQHLPASFMPYFAAQVAVLAGRPCEVVTDRVRLRAGRIYVAPGDAHVRCISLGEGEAALRLVHEPVASGCMPSVDPMLTSMAEVFGARMLAVVLSGMGRDGADGARVVRDAGGCVIVQDQESSVIWGMPGAIAQAGLADAVLGPEAIGRLAAARRRP